MDSRQELVRLIQRYKNGEATEAEVNLLLLQMKTGEESEFIENAISEGLLDDVPDSVTASLEMRQKLESLFETIQKKRNLPARKGLMKRLRTPLLVAGSVLMIATLSVVVYKLNLSDIAKTTLITRFGEDLPPGTNRATIILPTGAEIPLDGGHDGIRSSTGGISYLNGDELQGIGESAEITVKTPNAGQYMVVLPDSTKVWLNSASSITYPRTFRGVNREVHVYGEAYMEVRKMAEFPFVIKTDRQTIEVLGTTLNIRAFPEEPAAQTTLITGSTQVTDNSSGRRLLLKPGELASSSATGISVESIPADRLPGWKDGLLILYDADFAEVKRELERWYNVEFVGEPSSTAKITATLSRNVNLSELLESMESYIGIKFKIEGRRIMVR